MGTHHCSKRKNDVHRKRMTLAARLKPICWQVDFLFLLLEVSWFDPCLVLGLLCNKIWNLETRLIHFQKKAVIFWGQYLSWYSDVCSWWLKGLLLMKCHNFVSHDIYIFPWNDITLKTWTKYLQEAFISPCHATSVSSSVFFPSCNLHHLVHGSQRLIVFRYDGRKKADKWLKILIL